MARVRKEIEFPEDMVAWMSSASRQSGLSMSAYVRHLVAADLTKRFGPGWSDPSEQDHPGGDLDDKGLVKLNVVGDQGA